MKTNDHTAEVEQRIAAIHVHGEDACAFCKVREGAITNIKKCANCAFGVFLYNENGEGRGLCKYRIQTLNIR